MWASAPTNLFVGGGVLDAPLPRWRAAVKGGPTESNFQSCVGGDAHIALPRRIHPALRLQRPASPAAPFAGSRQKRRSYPCGYFRFRKGRRTAPPFSVSKKPRRVCRPQAAKRWNHFLSRHVRERKYISGCQCGILPQGGKIMRAADCNPFVGKTRRVFRQSQGRRKAPPFFVLAD